MPRALESWPEEMTRPRRKYDFEKMGVTDGRVWLLVKGSDYQCSENAIRDHLRKFAKETGREVKIGIRRRSRGGEAVVEGVVVEFTAPAAEPAVPRAAEVQARAA